MLCWYCTTNWNILASKSLMRSLYISLEIFLGLFYMHVCLFWYIIPMDHNLIQVFLIYYVQPTATDCSPLQHTATLCNTIQCIVIHCNVHCITLKFTKAVLLICYAQHTATHCNTLQHTATHCNTLQHTATHCNTPTQCSWCTTRNPLQHTATYCNALQCTVTHTATHYSSVPDLLCATHCNPLQRATTRQHTATH